ncbi:hypothetical protein IC229_10185 [Spirosoma sp. BT702]|uniref:Uncharacterized protein n=1 Tax=Spirosoma profusum TaxID=2771354 RepID=A0A926XUZ8_9BACT|nr:hypothetical protein [Spirosoma profusum]MBD2701003.1 hypothetical protein [Spirosoma profusum]
MNLFNLKKACLLVSLTSLYVVNATAQPIQRSNVPPPAFEVTGSIYPWEVHDEGIDLILDNMTGIAGVNSVYLIAVMHQEHRPFNNDNLPGTFTFIHNPVRTQWDAEDSRAYFKPHMEMYGKIKPLMSKESWLNDTDWLKIVLDKAHARGLRAGVEVSHTYIPVEYLNQHEEYKQRDINNKPVDRPCTNNSDVREYLVTLYGDLAQHYDVDYIQTCMLLFSRSDDPVKGGSCFCESCKHKAKAMGFNMEEAIPVLKDNPYAEPQLTNWRNFRKACTTEIYKLVTDRIHKENPNIDFRLNDLNDRTSGLTLEELKDNINSVHLSTHTEQNGYQKSDRKSRILTTKHFMGDNIRIIPGVPTRLLTTPEIIKSSIKISVENGSKGIGIKHYDGSPYSNLRAVRNGLSEAGVSGFKPVMGMEVEDMTLTGYSADKFLIEKCVQTTDKGTAKSIFKNPSGTYNVVVSYADEKNGQGNLALSVGGKQKAAWKLTEDVNCWRRKMIPNVKINTGDAIEITGIANGSETAKVDFIEFIAQPTPAKSKTIGSE